MANHKSALKRIRQSEQARLRNKHNRTKMKSFVKRVQEALDAKDADAAKTALSEAIPMIDKAATKGAIKKQTASRKISRLSKAVHLLATT